MKPRSYQNTWRDKPYTRRASWRTGHNGTEVVYRGHVAVDWDGSFAYSEGPCKHDHTTRHDAEMCGRDMLAKEAK